MLIITSPPPVPAVHTSFHTPVPLLYHTCFHYCILYHRGTGEGLEGCRAQTSLLDCFHGLSVLLFFSNTDITSVVPGDYDGDSQMDVLVTTEGSSSDKSTTIYIFWGHGQTLGTLQQTETLKVAVTLQLTLAATRVHYSAASFCLLYLLLHFTVIFIKELHWASQPESREHMSTNRQTVFTENTQFFSPWAHFAISLTLILAAMHLIVFSVAAVTEVLPLKLKKYKNVRIILCNQYRWIDYAIGSRLNNINQCLVTHISNIDAAQLITVPLLCNILSWITIYSW